MDGTAVILKGPSGAVPVGEAFHDHRLRGKPARDAFQYVPGDVAIFMLSGPVHVDPFQGSGKSVPPVAGQHNVGVRVESVVLSQVLVELQ